jgi:hypothetical protein
MKIVRLSGLALLGLAVFAVGCDDDDDPVNPGTPTSFTASLDDANERPVVNASTNPTGSATFTVSGSTINYSVRVANTTSAVTQCHIHAAASDASGPIIVNLCDAAPIAGGVAVTTEREIATGTIQKSTSTSGKGNSPIDLDVLIQMIMEGHAYVNVHTTNNPAGEVRGTINPVTP